MGSAVVPAYEGLVLVTTWCAAVALLLGLITAGAWRLPFALIARRASLAIAVMAPALFHVLSPPRNSIEAAGRLVFLWPAAIVAIVAATAWAWRDRRRVSDVSR